MLVTGWRLPSQAGDEQRLSSLPGFLLRLLQALTSPEPALSTAPCKETTSWHGRSGRGSLALPWVGEAGLVQWQEASEAGWVLGEPMTGRGHTRNVTQQRPFTTISMLSPSTAGTSLPCGPA